MPMLNIGIIGTGSIASEAHAPALKLTPGVRLWSVLSRDSARAAEFAERHGASAPLCAHSSLQDFLSDSNLDAVIICSPDRLHYDQASACLMQGKHVLVEKPLVVDRESGEKLVALVDSSSLVATVGFHHRFHGAHQKLRDLLDDGAIGDVLHVGIAWAASSFDTSNWRAKDEVGAWWSLAALGVHCIDQVRWLFGYWETDFFQSKAVISSSRVKSMHDQTSIIGFDLGDGKTAEVTVSILFSSPSRVEVSGTSGYARLYGTLGRHGSGIFEMQGERIEYNAVNPFKSQLACFRDAITEATPVESTALQGLRITNDVLSLI